MKMISSLSPRIVAVILGSTIYLSLSGFQCASSMMNTAELAIQGGDYSKAKASAEEELALRPENARAWYLLGRAEHGLQNYVAMSKAFDEAIEHRNSESGALEPNDLIDIGQLRANAWGEVRGRAASAIREERMAAALSLLDTAEMVQPGNPLTLQLRATAFEVGDRTEEANEVYRSYVDLTRPIVRAGIDNDVALGLPIEAIRDRLGAPSLPYNPRGGRSPQSLADVYAGKNLAVYYAERMGKTVVVGWDIVSPEKEPYFNYGLTSDPYYNRALMLRSAKEYDEAIELLELAEQMDPDNSTTFGNLLGQIYIDAGRVEEAEAEIERRIALDPEDVRLRLRYSVLLYSTKDTAGAIGALKSALDISSLEKGSDDHIDILFNLGAYNKNWGYELDQVAEMKRGDQQAALYKEANEKYREALVYFKQLREYTEGFDYEQAYEVGNLMAIIEDKEGLSGIVSEFEAEQSDPDLAENGSFWRSLSKLYLWAGDTEKATEASEKAKELGR